MSRARHQYEMQSVTNELDFALNCAAIEIDTTNARAELATLRLEHDALIDMGKQCASLRADMQAARERSAEQARQLEAAREILLVMLAEEADKHEQEIKRLKAALKRVNVAYPITAERKP